MALKGISGTLASADLLENLGERPEAIARARTLIARASLTLGPARSARHVFDLLLAPLLKEAGLQTTILQTDETIAVAVFGVEGGGPSGIAAACRWGEDLRRIRERTARQGPVRWWIGCNGVTLRILDSSRAYARRAIDFDLERVADDDRAVAVLQALLTPGAGGLDTLERLLAESGRHRVEVGRTLQSGVENALARLVAGFSRRRRTVESAAAFADALTVVYRILFLLFAEARGLVPQWHPIYRASYTIESLRPRAEARDSPAGLWESLQAISRLAHRGCTAGSLRVVPFNGRLFAPAAAPIADSFRLDDGVAREVLLALTTRPGEDRRQRISYRDLGVEQLGAVYEHVLDYTPGGDRRKGSGTFYTPRPMTEFLVRRTLAPLVRERTPDEILALRVLDPAMGSGAFLVAACRYLADAYEDALVAEGGLTRGDITGADRAAFRRVVAQRCLYGVDVNPTAVQLARLSLWLCTLAADRPLSFLDHHLRAGDSLIGARVADVTRQPPGRGRKGAGGPLPLFEIDQLFDRLAATIDARSELARTPDDSADVVRAKERTTETLSGPSGPLAGWRAVADAWCAAWFWPGNVAPLDPRGWIALSLAMRGGESGLPARLESEWRAAAATAAQERRFFHWDLEFPEIFFAADGSATAVPGFDAVIGNPPWADAQAAASFSRESGCYRLQGRGHANLYQLFAERMLQLTRNGGRVGILMPSGLLADHGCAGIRSFLFERCHVDGVLGFENREGIFPIHRALRFTLVTATRGGSTTELASRFGLRAAAALEDVPDTGDPPGSVRIPLALVRRFSGEGLAVPELHCERDRELVARVLSKAPALGSADGWGARFGRVEGARYFVEPYAASGVLGARAHFDRARLGYREVASSTNRLTLIAAVIPAGVVTTHTIFCLRHRPAMPDDFDWFLCGVLNSFVANYLVRLRGGTHLPAAVMHQLPVPLVAPGSRRFAQVAALAREAARDAQARARLQAITAHAYGLEPDDFAHVLRTFSLVAEEERDAAIGAFRRGADAI